MPKNRNKFYSQTAASDASGSDGDNRFSSPNVEKFFSLVMGGQLKDAADHLDQNQFSQAEIDEMQEFVSATTYLVDTAKIVDAAERDRLKDEEKCLREKLNKLKPQKIVEKWNQPMDKLGH